MVVVVVVVVSRRWVWDGWSWETCERFLSRATGEFRAADMDCVDADDERLHSESTLITSVDSISASTADDPSSPSSNKVELPGQL